MPYDDPYYDDDEYYDYYDDDYDDEDEETEEERLAREEEEREDARRRDQAIVDQDSGKAGRRGIRARAAQQRLDAAEGAEATRASQERVDDAVAAAKADEPPPGGDQDPDPEETEEGFEGDDKYGDDPDFQMSEEEVNGIYHELFGRSPDDMEMLDGRMMSRAELFRDLTGRDPVYDPTEAQADPSVSTDIYRMINRDKEIWEGILRKAADDRGLEYTPGDLEGVLRKVRRQGQEGYDPQQFINEQIQTYDERRATGQTGDTTTTGTATGDTTTGDTTTGAGRTPPTTMADMTFAPDTNQNAYRPISASELAWYRGLSPGQQDLYDDYIRRNPGDYARAASAMTDDPEFRSESVGGSGAPPSGYGWPVGRNPDTGAGLFPVGGGGPAPSGTGQPYTGQAYTGQPYGGQPYGGQPYYGAGAGPSGVQSLMGPWQGMAPPTPTMGSAAFDPYAAPTPYMPPVPYQPGIYTAPIYTPGAPFTPPTGAQLTADPSYQFRLQQGQEALERSGAARGVTNTGGTLKNILDYGQQAASQEYGNVYNRAANTWGMNEAARQASFGLNAPQQFQAWGATEGARLGAYQMTEADRAAAYAQNEANRRASAQFNQMGYQQAWQNEAQRRQQDYNNRYRQWTDQYAQWRQQGQDRFNEQWMLANA